MKGLKHCLLYCVMLLLGYGASAQTDFNKLKEKELKGMLEFFEGDSYVFSAETKYYKNQKRLGDYMFKIIKHKQSVYSENSNGISLYTKDAYVILFNINKVMVYGEPKKESVNKRKKKKIENQLLEMIDSLVQEGETDLKYEVSHFEGKSAIRISSEEKQTFITYNIHSDSGRLISIVIDVETEYYDQLVIEVKEWKQTLKEEDYSKLNLNRYVNKSRNGVNKLFGEFEFKTNK